jgi:23S rRNA (cytidine1920-2'-O)/16S rRNA (cytidine1409-2'-O)-methyltransferase
VGKGGVVRDAETRIETLVRVAGSAQADGWSVMGFAPSGLAGPSGNLETFAWLAEPGRDGAVDDVEAAARAVTA